MSEWKLIQVIPWEIELGHQSPPTKPPTTHRDTTDCWPKPHQDQLIYSKPLECFSSSAPVPSACRWGWVFLKYPEQNIILVLLPRRLFNGFIQMTRPLAGDKTRALYSGNNIMRTGRPSSVNVNKWQWHGIDKKNRWWVNILYQEITWIKSHSQQSHHGQTQRTWLSSSLKSSPIMLSGVKEGFSSFVPILEIYIIIGIWNGRLLIQSTRPEVGNKGRPELTPLTWWTGGWVGI